MFYKRIKKLLFYIWVFYYRDLVSDDPLSPGKTAWYGEKKCSFVMSSSIIKLAEGGGDRKTLCNTICITLNHYSIVYPYLTNQGLSDIRFGMGKRNGSS